MAELADAQDLGSCALRRMGSSPTDRTKRVKLELTIFLRGSHFRVCPCGFEDRLVGYPRFICAIACNTLSYPQVAIRNDRNTIGSLLKNESRYGRVPLIAPRIKSASTAFLV